MSTSPTLILASQSPYRKALLARLGYAFEAVSPQADEEELKKIAPQDPTARAQFLSYHKAKSIFEQTANIVIGSDQLLVLKNEVLDKPLTKEKAFEQLSKMQGRVHSLITAVTLFWPGGMYQWSVAAHMDMRSLTEEEIFAYIDKDQPLDCAGSYKLERAGVTLFNSIECSDWTAIEGLPLVTLAHHLRKIGF